jgi:Glycosyl hydrolase family 10
MVYPESLELIHAHESRAPHNRDGRTVGVRRVEIAHRALPDPHAAVHTPGRCLPLRDAAMSAGKLVGAAVQSSLLGDPRYSEVLGRHFNYLTAEYEMKWDPIDRVRGTADVVNKLEATVSADVPVLVIAVP